MFPRRTSFITVFLFMIGGWGLFALDAVRASGGHLSSINAVAVDSSGTTAFSAAKDGSIVKWNLTKRIALERFQVSPYSITGLALRPNTDEIAVIETDGFGLYRISAWNFKDKQKLFTLRFRDAVSFITYSEKGSFLIAARNSYDGVVLLDPQSGEKTNQLQEATGLVSFASTGKSERTMVTYANSGELCYWNLSSGERIERIKAPASLSSPMLFGNGRLLFGSTGTEIVISDALASKEIARHPANGMVVAVPAEGSDSVLQYLLSASDELSIGTVTVNQDREVFVSAERLIVANGADTITLPAIAARNMLIASSKDGKLSLVDPAAPLPAPIPLKTTDYAVAKDISDSGAFLTVLVNDSVVRVPVRPETITQDEAMEATGTITADRILALNDKKLVAWKTDGTAPPRILDSSNFSYEVPLRVGSNITAVRSYKDTVLFLDSGGMLTLFDTSQRSVLFSFASIGALDATIIDDRRLILGKSSSVSPKVPLLLLNYRTGETVPLDVQGKAAVRLYRGLSDAVYAVIADADEAGPLTKLIRFDPDSSGNAASLIEYRAEDVQASIAELGDSVATTLGGDGASVFKPSGFLHLERTEYIPKKLIATNTHIVSIGEDGAIVWHEIESGTIYAVLRFFKDSWELVRNGGTILTGTLTRN